MKRRWGRVLGARGMNLFGVVGWFGDLNVLQISNFRDAIRGMALMMNKKHLPGHPKQRTRIASIPLIRSHGCNAGCQRLDASCGFDEGVVRLQ